MDDQTHGRDRNAEMNPQAGANAVVGAGIWVMVVASAAVLLHAGVPHLERYEYSQIHMGVAVRIVLYERSEPAAARAATLAYSRIASLDAEMSDYRPDSATSEVARRAPAPVRVPPDLLKLAGVAQTVAKETGGAFDPTVAPLVALWRDARKKGRLPASLAIDRARALVGWQQIEIDPANQTIRLAQAGMKLDAGGIAKGYILGAALETLERAGVDRALLEAGGDVVVGDAPPGRAGWRIDLPNAATMPVDFVARASALTNAALSTSGPSMQFVEIGGVRYSHVIDPRSGEPLTSSLSAHVIAEDPALSDALATAATVVGPPGLPQLRTRFPNARIELAGQQTTIPTAGLPGDRSAYDWVPLFNGKDLSGWMPKFARHDLGINLNDTFRVDDGLLQVRYDKWEGFNGEFGHLFYREPFSHYVIAAEYRFVGEQLPAARAHSWAARNNGFMLHSQDPSTMLLTQDFPISIEVQFLGGLGAGAARPTANLCTPGTHVVMNGQLRTAHCTNSRSRTYDGDVWVRVEVLVLGDDVIRHVIDGETVLEYTKPQIGGGNASPTDPAVKIDGTPLARGFIAIQSETAPADFRKIEIVNLEGCADPKARNYRAYIVKSNPAMCRY
jgi:thiamine biosynthesis lipoprotein ApbE